MFPIQTRLKNILRKRDEKSADNRSKQLYRDFVRDELEIPVKAKIDGKYVEKRDFFYDIGLMFKTVFSVFKHDGVVEGGTGEIHREKGNQEDINENIIHNL